MKVLVAHSDGELRRIVRSVLEPLGNAVVEAGTTADALERCRAEAPDVALLQESLSRRDGIALLDAVKRDIDLFRIAVVLIHAGLGVEPTREALRRGAHDVLSEPLDPAELVARVHAAERTRVLQLELSAQAARLESLVFGDELTGLVNRRFLLTQLAALVSGARRHERPMSVVMIDIDHFKRINDVHGHPSGDAVLAAVAATLKGRLRAEDLIGRLGGEEFLALLPDDEADGAAVVAESLRHAVEHVGVKLDDDILRVTVSAGWATLEPDEDAAALLLRADEALYAAKAAGRNVTRGADTLRRRP